jgi:hypothetical protein
MRRPKEVADPKIMADFKRSTYITTTIHRRWVGNFGLKTIGSIACYLIFLKINILHRIP